MNCRYILVFTYPYQFIDPVFFKYIYEQIIKDTLIGNKLANFKKVRQENMHSKLVTIETRVKKRRNKDNRSDNSRYENRRTELASFVQR